MRVRALSVREPWAQLILLGRKAAEFRTWRPTPRVLAPGQDLVICSSLRMDQSLVRRGISARLWTPAEVNLAMNASLPVHANHTCPLSAAPASGW